MKIVLLSLILSFPLFLNGDDKPIDYDRLEKREVNGEVLLFIVDSKNPFTGITTTSRYENGQKRSALGFKAGKMDGLSTRWYENGQKKSEDNFKDGKMDGLWARWYENGQKESESNFKDGKMDGLWARWYENGQKESEGNFKEDKPDGVHLYYDETGKETMRSSYLQGILKSVLKPR